MIGIAFLDLAEQRFHDGPGFVTSVGPLRLRSGTVEQVLKPTFEGWVCVNPALLRGVVQPGVPHLSHAFPQIDTTRLIRLGKDPEKSLGSDQGWAMGAYQIPMNGPCSPIHHGSRLRLCARNRHTWASKSKASRRIGKQPPPPFGMPCIILSWKVSLTAPRAGSSSQFSFVLLFFQCYFLHGLFHNALCLVGSLTVIISASANVFAPGLLSRLLWRDDVYSESGYP